MSLKKDLSEWEIASTKKMMGYGFGYIVVNYLLLYGLSQMDFFYRNAVGLSGFLIFLATVIFAIWNMVNDPLLGYITDKPRKWTRKYGLRAPWIIVSTAPMFILFILIWTPPMGDEIIIFIYLVIIICLFDTFFSIYNDHLYGGYTNQFPSEYERRRSFAIMTVMLFSILIIMQVLTSVILGGKEYEQPAYLTNAIIMIILLVIFSIPVFLAVRESKEMKEMFISTYEASEKASFIKVTKTALKQKNFRVSLLGYTVQVTATTLWNAAQLYLFVDVYGLSIATQTLPLLIGILAVIGSVPFWYNYTRKHDFKRTYWLCFLLHGLSFIPFLFITDLVFHTIFFIFMMIFYGGEVTMLMPVASDTYDEVAVEMGQRQDATFVGIRNFFFRIAFLIQAFVFFMILVLVTDYVPAEAQLADFAGQSSEAKLGIRVMGALIPGLLFIVMSLIFKKYYTLVGEEKAVMIKKLKEAGLYRA